MSWGYFVDLNLTLPAADWRRLRSRDPADVELRAGWSGLSDRALERRFVARDPKLATSFAATLDAKAYRGPEVVRTIAARGSVARVRVCVLLDKSQLELAWPLVALLYAARDTAAEGSLRLVNDGTYAGDPGVVLRLARAKIRRSPLADVPDVAAALGAELVTGAERTTDVRPSERARPIGRNPLTGKPIYAKPGRG